MPNHVPIGQITTSPRCHDDDAAAQDDGDQEEAVSLSPDASGNILPAVEKVSQLITYPRS